jgi:hypothetical protein
VTMQKEKEMEGITRKLKEKLNLSLFVLAG